MTFIEADINENCDLNLSVIKQVLKLICEQYLIAIHRQVGKFYLGSGWVIEKVLESNASAQDAVPTTQLTAEYSVANAHRANRDHQKY